MKHVAVDVLDRIMECGRIVKMHSTPLEYYNITISKVENITKLQLRLECGRIVKMHSTPL